MLHKIQSILGWTGRLGECTLELPFVKLSLWFGREQNSDSTSQLTVWQVGVTGVYVPEFRSFHLTLYLFFALEFTVNIKVGG